MFRQFQGAISQAEKANIVLKLRGARQRIKAKTGRCEGRKPYGDRSGEGEVIARMKELRVSGMSFDAIAAALNTAGVPTRTPGKKWHGFAINQILKRSNDDLRRLRKSAPAEQKSLRSDVVSGGDQQNGRIRQRPDRELRRLGLQGPVRDKKLLGWNHPASRSQELRCCESAEVV
jgi:hypothetical protein